MLCNNGRMMDKSEEFKVNTRIFALNLAFGFSIKIDERKI